MTGYLTEGGEEELLHKCEAVMEHKIRDDLTLPYHLHHAPPVFGWIWGISTVVAIICVLLWVKHTVSLWTAGNRLRRLNNSVFPPQLCLLYIKMFSFFPLIGILGWASTFLPRFSLMFSLLLHLYEVACLMWFWELMIDLLDGPDASLSILAAHSPRYVWNAPPLCCVAYAMRPRRFHRKDIVYTWWLVVQYAVLSVVCVLTAVISETAKERFQYGTVASLLLCMWGLFVIYKASYKESKQFHLARKFACLKLIVVVIKGSEILCRLTGVVSGADVMYSKFVMSQIWASFIPGVIALPFTAAAMFAFPSSDICNRHLKHAKSFGDELATEAPRQDSSSTSRSLSTITSLPATSHSISFPPIPPSLPPSTVVVAADPVDTWTGGEVDQVDMEHDMEDDMEDEMEHDMEDEMEDEEVDR